MPRAPIHHRPYVCRSCKAEFKRRFDGKKPAKLKKQKAFCPRCGSVGETTDK